jgi:hypothetical protein
MEMDLSPLYVVGRTRQYQHSSAYVLLLCAFFAYED